MSLDRLAAFDAEPEAGEVIDGELAVTDDVLASVNIGLVTNVVKTGTYYGYERLWDRIAWGV